MSKSKITKTIDYLSEPRKAIVAAVLLVLAIVVVVFLWKKAKGLWTKKSLPELFDDTAIEANTGTSITPSIDFRMLVIRLWDACANIGTNEAEVYAVMESLNNQADYMKLGNTWIQQHNSLGWLARQALPGTLPAMLQSELNKSELAKVRSILTSKGITPDF